MTMNLDEAQKRTVAAWIGEGLTLSEIQKRLAAEFGLHITYMEARFLLDDLKLKPKDKEVLVSVPPSLPGKAPTPAAPVAGGKTPPTPSAEEEKEEDQTAFGGVSVKVDTVTRAGAMVSGSVTFSDGNQAEWYLDQFGRLGLSPKQQGYRPSQTDLMNFQTELQNELGKMGF
jgi:hypothetical protein